MELTLLFIAVITIQAYTSHREKRQLLQTIEQLGMQIKAKDLGEYVKETQPIPQYEPVAMTEEEEYYRDIEDGKRQMSM